MNLVLWIGVAALGGLGAISRFLLDAAVSSRAGRDFPVGTLVVNLTGAFALGVLAGVTLDDDAHLLAATAALGSYTTFSTWMLETHRLGEEGEGRGAAVNITLSLGAGLGAVALGRSIGGSL